jgi:hypothetical protein
MAIIMLVGKYPWATILKIEEQKYKKKKRERTQ